MAQHAVGNGVCHPRLNGRAVARPADEWGPLAAALGHAEQYGAAAGARVPDMAHHRGLRGWLARATTRLVPYLARVITNDQRSFNAAALDALRDLADRQRRQAEAQQGLERRLQALERSVAHLRQGLVLQERRVGLLLEEARRRLPGPLDREQL